MAEVDAKATDAFEISWSVLAFWFFFACTLDLQWCRAGPQFFVLIAFLGLTYFLLLLSAPASIRWLCPGAASIQGWVRARHWCVRFLLGAQIRTGCFVWLLVCALDWGGKAWCARDVRGLSRDTCRSASARSWSPGICPAGTDAAAEEHDPLSPRRRRCRADRIRAAFQLRREPTEGARGA